MKNEVSIDTNILPVYFVIGTRAQFIKVAPIMHAMVSKGLPYTLLYTAQHRENIHEILEVYNLRQPDVVMYTQQEANTRGSFLLWFMSVFYKSFFQSRKFIPKPGILLTHGDTFTAWLAALMGKRAGCVVGHLESGCRSYNLFSPFPEEISRLITFRLSDIYFCADEWAMDNLKKYKGRKVNMGANTMLDGVRYALGYPIKPHFDFEDAPFALVSIHRFENIFTARFTDVIMPILKDIARNCHIVFVLHPTTRERLHGLGLIDELNTETNITLQARFGFIDWVNICNKAEFVITDGGSNQEELSYLGVPTLLFRYETERQEGLGGNVVLSKFDRNIINDFVSNPGRYRKKPQFIKANPSETIIQVVHNTKFDKKRR